MATNKYGWKKVNGKWVAPTGGAQKGNQAADRLEKLAAEQMKTDKRRGRNTAKTAKGVRADISGRSPTTRNYSTSARQSAAERLKAAKARGARGQ